MAVKAEIGVVGATWHTMTPAFFYCSRLALVVPARGLEFVANATWEGVHASNDDAPRGQ